MSYIVEYTTLSGKRIPILHKIFESVADAELHGRKGVAEGNYRAYAVVEAANQEKQYRVTAKSLDDNSTFKGGVKSKEAADKEAEKLRNAKSKRGGKSFDNVKVVTEGYKELPKMDTERYGERAGLEGPFQTMAGKVVYYDPKEGAYYDPDTDRYMSYDEFRALDNDYSGMRDERDIPVKEAVTIDYSRYMRSHGKKPRDTGGATWMFTTAEYGSPKEDDIFQFQGNFADAKRAAAGWARSRGAGRVYAMESDVNEADVVDFSAYAGMYSDGARAVFQGRDGETHTLTATGDRPRRYFINGKETSWEDVKRAVGNQKLHPQQGMTEADDDRDELTKKLFPRRSREEMEKADRERNRAMNAKRFMKPGKPSRSREWGAYEGVNEAEAGTYMKQWYNYSEDFAMLELYVDGKLVDKWSDYFGANETGNPLQAKFIEMAKANGVDPIGLKVVDGEDGDEGVFTSSGLKWNTNEAVAKIACLKCDEVSTAKAWQKNNGFCPKCKTSSQGVAESINEGISDDAHHMERDHEVQMARSDLYKTANYAIKLHAILKGISEEQGLDGWMQAKITKAADYLSSVFHALEYDQLERGQSEPMMPMESADKDKIQKQIDQTEKHMKSFSGNTSSVKMKKVALQKKIAGLKAKLEELSESKTASQHRQKMIDKTKKSGAVKSGSMNKDDKKVDEARRSTYQTMRSAQAKEQALKARKEVIDKLKKYDNDKKTDKKVDETTTAGAIATAPMPMGKMIKRRKK